MRTQDFSLQIKSAEDDGTFVGYASVYGGAPDSYGDVVENSAFSNSLAKHQREGTAPLMLWMHDPAEPIGVWERMSSDGRGLLAEGRILRGVQKAEEAYIRIKAGAVKGLSIGYREIKATPDGNIRRLQEVDLIEVSIVSMPAQKRARITSVKQEEFASGWEEFARAIRDENPLPIKHFEQLLRDAGLPKSVAVHIASKGYSSIFRSESGDKKDANLAALAELRAAAAGFLRS